MEAHTASGSVVILRCRALVKHVLIAHVAALRSCLARRICHIKACMDYHKWFASMNGSQLPYLVVVSWVVVTCCVVDGRCAVGPCCVVVLSWVIAVLLRCVVWKVVVVLHRVVRSRQTVALGTSFPPRRHFAPCPLFGRGARPSRGIVCYTKVAALNSVLQSCNGHP
jgi:hypothetical protein